MGGEHEDHTDDGDEDGFHPPLPIEDRLWRHPSEMAAELRAAQPTVTVTTIRTSWRQALGLATIGAIGGGLVVAGLFLTLGSTTTPPATSPSTPAISTLAYDPVFPVPRSAPEDGWADEVAEVSRQGVVEVHVDGVHVGAGVLIRNDGVIVTSHDIAVGAGTVTVRMADGSTHAGRLLGTDAISGLAAIDIDHEDTPTSPLAILKTPPQVGDYAVALPALADGEEVELDVRTIAATSMSEPVADDLNLHGLIQLDGPAPALTSGGPMIDDGGAVLGIVVNLGSEHATHAVPIAYARKIAEDFITYGAAKHSWLGIKGVPLADDQAADLELDGGVRVTSVIESSPAAASELRKGDVIVGLDGVEILSMTELILELRKHPPNEKVEIRYLRSGAPGSAMVTIATRHMGDTT